MAGVVALGVLGAGGLAVHARAAMAKGNTPESLNEFLVQQPLVHDLSAHAERMKRHQAERAEEGDEGEAAPKEEAARNSDGAPRRRAEQAALRDAAEMGMIGLLNSGAGGDPDAPTAPWGRDDSLGKDPLSARGNMWGDSIGESFGAGGLGLAGVGGGGRGEGVGLGGVGSVGSIGTGSGRGYGSGSGGLGRSRRARPPRVRAGRTTATGRLAPEIISRIVRSSFGRFRLCYEAGLKTDPALSGRVAVRFTIQEDGTVSAVSGSGDLSDQGVVSCVTRAFYALTFPKPEGGIVTVSYPIVFAPGAATKRRATEKTSKRADESEQKQPAKAQKPKKLKVRFRRLRSSGIDTAAIKKLLKKKRSKFRKCYADARATDPGLKGSLRLSFTVTPTGDVVIGKREDMVLATFSDEVADCVFDLLDDITFPTPTSGAAVVSFRVAFSS